MTTSDLRTARNLTNNLDGLDLNRYTFGVIIDADSNYDPDRVTTESIDVHIEIPDSISFRDLYTLIDYLRDEGHDIDLDTLDPGPNHTIYLRLPTPIDAVGETSAILLHDSPSGTVYYFDIRDSDRIDGNSLSDEYPRVTTEILRDPVNLYAC